MRDPSVTNLTCRAIENPSMRRASGVRRSQVCFNAEEDDGDNNASLE